VRADSGFCRWKMLRWCEQAGVNYIVGLAKNERLRLRVGTGDAGSFRKPNTPSEALIRVMF